MTLQTKLSKFNQSVSSSQSGVLASDLDRKFSVVIPISPEVAKQQEIRLLQSQINDQASESCQQQNTIKMLRHELMLAHQKINGLEEKNMFLEDKVFSVENPIKQNVKNADFDYNLDLNQAVVMIDKVKKQLQLLREEAQNLVQIPGLNILQGQILVENENFQANMQNTIQLVDDILVKKCHKCNKQHLASSTNCHLLSNSQDVICSINKSVIINPCSPMKHYERSFVDQKVCSQISSLKIDTKLVCDAPLLRVGKDSSILTPKTLDTRSQ